MPSSPVMKKVTLPDNWVQLQKIIIPDQATACYWSVWYDVELKFPKGKGTAWLMWCQFDDAAQFNDNWHHVEDMTDDCRNILNVIESVFGVSFHESIWKDITPEQMWKDNPIV